MSAEKDRVTAGMEETVASLPELPEPSLVPRRVLQDGALSLVTSAAIQVLGVISGVVTARLLGPTGKGELAAILLWSGVLAAVGGFGFVDAVVYFTAQKPDRTRAIAITALTVAAAQSLVFLGLGLVLVPALLAHYGNDVVGAARVHLLWIPLNLLAITAMGVLQGRLAMGLVNSFRLTVIGATVAGLLGLYMAQQVSLLNVVLIYLGSTLLTLLLILFSLRSRGWFGTQPDPALVRPMTAYGLKSYVGGITSLVNERAGQTLLSLFLAPAHLGLYSVAATLSAGVTMLGVSFSLVVLPALANAGSGPDMRRHFALYVRLTFALSIIVAAASSPLVPPFIEIFFGPAFLPATSTAQVLLLAAVLLSANRVLTAGLKAFNRPIVPSVAEILGAILGVVALLWLLPAWGHLGAAMATVLAYSASGTYMVWFSHRHLSISVRTLLIPNRSDVGHMWRWSQAGYRAAKERERW